MFFPRFLLCCGGRSDNLSVGKYRDTRVTRRKKDGRRDHSRGTLHPAVVRKRANMNAYQAVLVANEGNPDGLQTGPLLGHTRCISFGARGSKRPAPIPFMTWWTAVLNLGCRDI